MKEIFEERIIDGVLNHRMNSEEEFVSYSLIELTNRMMENNLIKSCDRVIKSLKTNYHHLVSKTRGIDEIKEISLSGGSRFEIYNKDNKLGFVIFSSDFVIEYKG